MNVNYAGFPSGLQSEIKLIFTTGGWVEDVHFVSTTTGLVTLLLLWYVYDVGRHAWGVATVGVSAFYVLQPDKRAAPQATGENI